MITLPVIFLQRTRLKQPDLMLAQKGIEPLICADKR